MSATATSAGPPGTEQPKRFRPALRYELIGCGLHGHELLGTDAASLRPEDVVFARESTDLRWYRCLRCDSWLPLPPPVDPRVPHPPERDDVSLPLRGRPLRDRYVLRLIAVDRVLHFLVLGALAGAILLFANHRDALQRDYVRILDGLQGGAGGPQTTGGSWLTRVQSAFHVSQSRLYLAGVVVAAYALLEGAEAVGLWWGKRWAEYCTFVATVVLIPLEVYELAERLSALKVVTLVLNAAIAVYLLASKRLFGLRGGSAALRAEHARDSGWAAIERATPGTEVAAVPD